jgi:hypothetical protein
MPIRTAHYAQLAAQVYLHPAPTHPWDEIVTGLVVHGKRMAAVDRNTWRAFHRVDIPGPGSKDVFVPYFSVNPGPAAIIQQLSLVSTTETLDQLANSICGELRHRLLNGNIKPHQLHPHKYNKLRKPVDIYLEALVSMATELTPHRARLTPLLRVPLDKWIFGEPTLFTEQVLRAVGLNRDSGFGELEHEADYVQLQAELRNLATECAAHHQCPFHPIYFDLLWANRHTRNGGNLFQLNP